MIDILIQNAQIVDGANRPRFPGDIAIEGDRVEDIGRWEGADAAMVIDAAGCVVAPGFIDMHSHADYTLPIAPEADSLVHQGITTVVTGQCGGTPAPLNRINRKAAVSMVSTLLPPGTPAPWQSISTFGDFLDYLENVRTAINMAPLVGQGTIRSAVMGYRADRPSETEIEQMQRLIDEALDSGAFGVSTGLIYAPGSFTSTDELVETLTPMARRGGIYFSHIRNEADKLLEAIDEAIEIGRRIGAPVQISHFKAVSEENWEKAARGLELIDRARAEGLDVTTDMYPYVAGSTGLDAMLPGWTIRGGRTALLKRLASPKTRKIILEAWRTGGGEITDKIAWEKILISSSKEKNFIGHFVSELANEEGKDPYEWALDALLKTGADIGFVDFLFSEDNLRMQMKHPAMMFGTDGVGLSSEGPLAQGVPHPRSFGTYPHILKLYVREKEVLSLEEACWKSSGFPAQKLGLKDRGVIRKGYKADLVIFDPDTIADRATFLEPFQYPIGIQYVIVNGKIVVDHGIQTNDRPGRVIHRG